MRVLGHTIMGNNITEKSKAPIYLKTPIGIVKMTSNAFTVHLGPYMPFNSGGLYNSIVHNNNTIKTDSTIKYTLSKQ